MAEQTTERKIPRSKRAVMVKKVIDNIGHKLESKEADASVAEFVKLLQYEKELQQDRGSKGPREVVVKWVTEKEEEPLPAA